MKLVFTGLAGSGKDFLADYLIKNYQYKRIAFADTLKTTVADIFPFIKEFYSPEEKELPLNIEISGKIITKTPRDVWLETSSFLRQYDELYFHNKTLENIKKSLDNKDNIIITDLRMMQEFEDLRELGFTIIHINNPTNNYPLNKFDEQIKKFSVNCDYYFTNNMNGTQEFKEFLDIIKIKG